MDNYFQLKITNEKLIKIYVTNIYVKERTKLYKKISSIDLVFEYYRNNSLFADLILYQLTKNNRNNMYLCKS